MELSAVFTDRELKPNYKHGIQIGPCGMCDKAGNAWQRPIIGGTRLITLHFCPVLNDNVSEFLGGCHEFILDKTKVKKKQRRKKTEVK